jgi:hypothetical protein
MRKLSILFLAVVAVGAQAVLPPHIAQSLNQLEQSSNQVHRNAGNVPRPDRRRVAARVESTIELLQDALYELEHGGGGGGGGGFGQFYQVNGQECTQFCASQGLRLGVSPEGAQCVSGENRAASAIGQIAFVNGCWPNCSGEAFSNAMSDGRFCYKPGQKRDNDRTDVTVGCFCEGGFGIRH